MLVNGRLIPLSWFWVSFSHHSISVSLLKWSTVEQMATKVEHELPRVYCVSPDVPSSSSQSSSSSSPSLQRKNTTVRTMMLQWYFLPQCFPLSFNHFEEREGRCFMWKWPTVKLISRSKVSDGTWNHSFYFFFASPSDFMMIITTWEQRMVMTMHDKGHKNSRPSNVTVKACLSLSKAKSSHWRAFERNNRKEQWHRSGSWWGGSTDTIIVSSCYN